MNNLQPDDKLPSERDMAAMLQTSRNSVREGLRILEDRGLIYVKTGSGVFVKDPYGEHSAISVRLTECTTEELQELQTILDHQAVLNAISRGTREEKKSSFLLRLSLWKSIPEISTATRWITASYRAL